MKRWIRWALFLEYVAGPSWGPISEAAFPIWKMVDTWECVRTTAEFCDTAGEAIREARRFEPLVER